MSITNFRAAEPLYIVILRNQQAENLLRSWVRENKVEHASVTGNRMMLHHQQAFENFRLTWAHDWDLVTVWDTWNKRHIYI
jgi:hypothetical protein